jgi:hypothetical protein
LRKSSHIIQGVNIHVDCDQRMHLFISNILNSFYAGEELRPEIKPIIFELSIVNEPPPVPANAIRAIKALNLTIYANGKDMYYALKDGSIIKLNPTMREAKGFFRKEALNDSAKLLTLITAPLAEILKYQRLYSLHSAALYSNGVGYLVSGGSGSGKTTTSLSMVSEGFKYVSDDAVLLEETNGDITVHSVCSTFNIDKDLAERFPDVVKEKDMLVKNKAKVSVAISEIFPDSFISYLRPDVILFPEITSNKKSQIYPIGQMEVYVRLLRQTVLAVDNEVSKNQLKTIERLVKQTQGFDLLSGRDIFENPKRFINLIRDANGQNGNGKKNKV